MKAKIDLILAFVLFRGASMETGKVQAPRPERLTPENAKSALFVCLR
jgi:hypothetical protein